MAFDVDFLLGILVVMTIWLIESKRKFVLIHFLCVCPECQALRIFVFFSARLRSLQESKVFTYVSLSLTLSVHHVTTPNLSTWDHPWPQPATHMRAPLTRPNHWPPGPVQTCSL